MLRPTRARINSSVLSANYDFAVAPIRLEFRPEIEAIGLSQKPTAHCFYSFVRLIGLGSTNTPSP
jgi:hypothetical protein